MRNKELIACKDDDGRRIDRVLRKALPDYPLSLIHRFLRRGRVLVNGKLFNAQDRVYEGDVIAVPSLKEDSGKLRPAKIASNAPQEPQLEILWQNEGLIAFNKPVGLAVHGQNSLDEMARIYLADKLPSSLSFKPGPLHRLDKMTSGIIIFSSTLEGARVFSSLMRDRKVKKTYLAIVEGKIKSEQVWEDHLTRDKERKKTFITDTGRNKGKESITKVKPLSSVFYKDMWFTFISAEIATGRTHQIRAQAACRGHPLANDRKYGSKTAGNEGFYLHAWKLEFMGYLIKAPLPSAFSEKLSMLKISSPALS